MTNEALQETYRWARGHLNQRVLLDYVLHKVNGQTPGVVLILLRQPHSQVPNVEVEVIYGANSEGYQAIFHVLPFQNNLPRPDILRSRFPTQQAVIHWIKTGRRQIPA